MVKLFADRQLPVEESVILYLMRMPRSLEFARAGGGDRPDGAHRTGPGDAGLVARVLEGLVEPGLFPEEM